MSGTVSAARARQFGFDGLGRPTTDSVTTPGSGIDTGVLQIAVTYEIRGIIEHITSYDAASDGSVVNDVLRVYNGFTQLITEYQEHTGAVETMSSANVQYAYADGSDNTIRLRGIVYPNGTTLTVSYGTTGDTNDRLSRVESLIWTIGDSTGPVAEYAYLGVGTPVQVEYPEPVVQYNLAVASGDDHYTGLDDFGRVIANLWQNVSGTPVDMVRLNYGYDQASNRLWRQDAVAGIANFDELYGIDGLYRLKEMQRGWLNDDMDGINPGTLDFQQNWTLDPTGNWGEFKEYDDGSTLSLDQSRTSSNVNEITEFITHTGPAWQPPGYDPAGNMTTMPQPNALTDGYAGKFDAWNRLAKLVDNITSYTAQENRYDGRNFRVQRFTYTSGTLSETRQFYQSRSWQVLEERISGTTPDRQYVWGLRYIDDLVLRDWSSDGTLNVRHYALQDANWNVVALSDAFGTVQERFAYSAYGILLPLNPDFSDYAGSGYDWTVLYTGRELDNATGLMYYRMRYYHPALGVFVSRDPYRNRAGTNLYQYVAGSPLTSKDPLGLFEDSDEPNKGGVADPTCTAFCGPDVTNWFYNDLKSHLARVKALIGNFPAFRAEYISTAKFDFGYKWLNFSLGNCGSGKCNDTVWIGGARGTCVRKNVLGNIALGALAASSPLSHDAGADIRNAYRGTLFTAGVDAYSSASSLSGQRADNLAAFGLGHSLTTSANVNGPMASVAKFTKALEDGINGTVAGGEDPLSTYNWLYTPRPNAVFDINTLTLAGPPKPGKPLFTSDCKRCSASGSPVVYSGPGARKQMQRLAAQYKKSVYLYTTDAGFQNWLDENFLKY